MSENRINPNLNEFTGGIQAAGEGQAVSDRCATHARPGPTSTASFDARDNHGAGAFSSSDEYRISEANRRLGILHTADELTVQGKSKKEIAKLVGQNEVTLYRWAKAFKAEGFNGLLPKTDKCGRKTVLEKLCIPQEVIDEIRGLNLDTQSTTAALRVFAQSDRCPEELSKIILDPNRCSKHALPPSLRRSVGVAANLRKAHEGPRSLSLGGIYTPRKLDILPGDIFCSDDTTPIWAWWVPWIESEEYPFGVKLLQGQLLPVIDVASQCVVNFALIAREKSSYRACDIWGLFGHTFDTVGVPRLGFQLERGSWEAGIVAGQEVEYQDGEITMSRRVGGLRQIPTSPTAWHQEKLGAAYEALPKTLQTWTSYLPKTKSIEAFFNRSQTLEGMLWGALGRDQMRRPNEKAKKLFQQCSRIRAKEDPRHHFLSQQEITVKLMEMMRYLNNEPMEGEVFKGIPEQNFKLALEQYPLMKLPEDQRWLYRSSWKAVKITQGWARVRLTHDVTGERYSLFYQNAAVFAQYEGADVVVYFDQDNFERPAQILLARTGEFLCEAAYFDRVGSFLGGDKTGHDIRKVWRSASMTAYADIVKHAPSRQLPAEIQARRDESKAAARATAITAAATSGEGTRIVEKIPPAQPQGFGALEPMDDRAEERLSRQAARARRLMEISGQQ